MNEQIVINGGTHCPFCNKRWDSLNSYGTRSCFRCNSKINLALKFILISDKSLSIDCIWEFDNLNEATIKVQYPRRLPAIKMKATFTEINPSNIIQLLNRLNNLRVFA